MRLVFWSRTKNFRYARDWMQVVDICSSENLIVVSRTPHLLLILTRTMPEATISTIESLLVETCRTTYARGDFSDFHNLELLHLDNSLFRRSHPSLRKEREKIETIWRIYRFASLSYPATIIVRTEPGVYVMGCCKLYCPNTLVR